MIGEVQFFVSIPVHHENKTRAKQTNRFGIYIVEQNIERSQMNGKSGSKPTLNLALFLNFSKFEL